MTVGFTNEAGVLLCSTACFQSFIQAVAVARYARSDDSLGVARMAKRHILKPGSWQSIFGRLEELVLANSGEDEFEEIFKILLAKLYSEQYGASFFDARASAAENQSTMNATLALAAERWKGTIHPGTVTHLTPEHLWTCSQAIADYSLRDSRLEVLDALFEHLISRSSKGAKGQFFTPRHVVDACVQIVRPKPHESVVDPACGSAGFLVHALNYVRETSFALDLSGYAASRLWGFDFDRRAIQVAKALMIVAGDGQSNLFRLNSLLNERGILNLLDDPATGRTTTTIEDVIRARTKGFAGFDVLLTNPPFAGEIREEGLLDSYELARTGNRTERDILFIERSIDLLRPGGRFAIVLPHNKLGSMTFDYVREWMLRQCQIVSVLALGRNTFQPHTSQKAAVVFGKKRDRPQPPPKEEPILFMVSEKEGKRANGEILTKEGFSDEDELWLRADHDLAEAVEQFSKFVDDHGLDW